MDAEDIEDDMVVEDLVDDIFVDPRGADYKEVLDQFSKQCAGRPAAYSKLRLKRGWAAIAAVQFTVLDSNSVVRMYGSFMLRTYLRFLCDCVVL